ncbi:MAG: tRNA pseudouridine synthase A [Ignavibacteria bacterium]|nr:tRNA pseudouridine synthase A [Ignavibacteria bacterium]
MYNYKLIIEYDGLNYFGWQKQKNTTNTIQEKIESAFKTVLKQEIKLTAAGRTDTKVSAYNQTANFFSEKLFDIHKILHSVNSILDNAITIKKISRVSKKFNSRHSAKSREYIYRITTQKKSINSNHYYRINFIPDFKKLDDFIKFLKIQKNFRSLCKNKEDKSGFYCDLIKLEYKYLKLKNEIIFIISGNRFLHSMIRAMLGCTLDIARGKENADKIKNLICKGEKFKIHYLPANALFLNKIKY